MTALLIVSILVLIPSALAQASWNWWPDPATHRGLSVWISYSSQYDSLWRDRAAVDKQVDDIARAGVDVVFLSLSSSAVRPYLQKLSDRADPLTTNVQYLLDGLSQRNVRACAAILSDFFTASETQVQRFVLVDHLLHFNASRGPGHAGFTCVATDLEMAASFRNTVTYDRWKQFHSAMRDRIARAGDGLKLLAWMQGPDFLISKMDDAIDRGRLLQREGIIPNRSDPTLYDGALKYFTAQGGQAIFDAVIPMWYFAASASYYRRLDHAVSELKALDLPDLYLIPGLMIHDAGQKFDCPACVGGRDDYRSRLHYGETIRRHFPRVIGTGVFLWPIPVEWSR